MAGASEAFAEGGVAGSKAEKAEAQGNEGEIEHGASVSVRRAGAVTGRARPPMWLGTALGFERDARTIL